MGHPKRRVRCELCGHLSWSEIVWWIGYRVCGRCQWDLRGKWRHLPVKHEKTTEADTCLFGTECFCTRLY